MKKISIITIYLLSWAFAQDLFIKEYKNIDAVFIAPRLSVNHSIRVFDEEKQQYLLKINSKYESTRSDEEIAKVKEQFKDYQIRLLSLRENQAHSKKELTLIPINRNETINIIQTSNGPIIQGEYLLSKNEADQMMESSDINEIIKIKDNNFDSGVNEVFTIEKSQVSRFKCKQLFKNSYTAFDIFRNYYEIVEKVNMKRFKYTSTKESLIENLLAECVGFPTHNDYQSFKDLMATELYSIAPEVNPSGSTEFILKDSFQAPLFLYSTEKR